MSLSIDQVLLEARRHAEKNETEMAEQLYRAVLDKCPENEAALNGIKALQQHPVAQKPSPGAPPQEHINELITLYNNRQFPEVLKRGEALVERYAPDAAIHNILGAANADLGRLEEAITNYSKALTANPEHAGAHYNLGNAFKFAGKPADAIAHYIKALKIRPDFVEAHNNLGAVLNDTGRHGEAAASFHNALRINPQHVDAYNNLGDVFRNLGQPGPAIDTYIKALSIEPGHIAAHVNLGNIFSDTGRYEEAMTSYAKALQYRPDPVSAELVYSISRLPKAFVKADIPKLIENARPESGQDKSSFRSTLAFARASAEHNAGHHHDAWKSLIEANRPLEDKFAAAFSNDMRINREILRQTRASTSFNEPPNIQTDDVPVSLFILGPSQSGKTTVERLVTGLPCVTPGYENLILENSARHVFNKAGISIQQRLCDLPPELNELFRMDYLNNFRKQCGDARVFTSTSPLNIKNASRAASILPNVRFIFIKRNLYDTIFRIFMNRYGIRNSYAYNIEHIRNYVLWYYEMIDVFSDRYPNISTVVQYESMIADPVTVLNAVSETFSIDATGVDMPELGDDRDCGKPYCEYIAAALRNTDADND